MFVLVEDISALAVLAFQNVQIFLLSLMKYLKYVTRISRGITNLKFPFLEEDNNEMFNFCFLFYRPNLEPLFVKLRFPNTQLGPRSRLPLKLSSSM